MLQVQYLNVDLTFVTLLTILTSLDILADVAFLVIVTFENQTLKNPDIHAMQKATESFIMKAILKSEQKSCNDTRMTIIKKVFNVSQRRLS